MTDKQNKIFNADYTKYWKTAVNNPVDKIQIPNENDILYWLKKFDLNNLGKTLDLGCSFGRLYPSLRSVSKQVFGCDPEPSSIELAFKYGYDHLEVGVAESTNFNSNFFDLVFSWGVFDTVILNDALIELNRISKNKVLFTGKSKKYFKKDANALIAERNAFLKGHGNRFTDLNLLSKYISKFGFRILKLILFPLRGDFAQKKYVELDVIKTVDIETYEYMILLEKTEDISKNMINAPHLWGLFSETMEMLARENDFKSCMDFFKEPNFKKIVNS